MRFDKGEKEDAVRTGQKTASKTKGSARRRRDQDPPHYALQQKLGNRAVQEVVKSGKLQPKLEVSRSVDPAEREADQTSDGVMQMDENSFDSSRENIRGGTSSLADQLNDQSVGELLRSADRQQGAEADDLLDEAVVREIQRRRGRGRPLPDGVRREAESAFDADVSHVRTHTDEHAAELAQRLHAKAFTVGGDIFFGESAYDPSNREGRELIGHELAHAVQHGEQTSTPRRVSTPEERSERVARRAGRLLAAQRGLVRQKSDPRSPINGFDDGEVEANAAGHAGGERHSEQVFAATSTRGCGSRHIIHRQEVETAGEGEEVIDPEEMINSGIPLFSRNLPFKGQDVEVKIFGRPHTDRSATEDARGGIGTEIGGRGTEIKIENLGEPTKLLESSFAALDTEGAVPWGPVTFSLDVAALESKLRGSDDIDFNLVEASVRVHGTVSQDQLEQLLNARFPGEGIVWDIGGEIKTSIGANARVLQRYLRNLDRIDSATRELDRVDRERARHRAQRQRLDRRLARTQRQIERAKNLPAAEHAQRTRELTRQWDAITSERAKVNQQLQRQNLHAQELRQEIRRLGRETADARRALDRGNPVGRRLRRGVATRAVARLGARLLVKLVPIVNVVSLGYDIYTIGRFLVGVFRGEFEFGGGRGSDGTDEGVDIGEMPPGIEREAENGKPGAPRSEVEEDPGRDGGAREAVEKKTEETGMPRRDIHRWVEWDPEERRIRLASQTRRALEFGRWTDYRADGVEFIYTSVTVQEQQERDDWVAFDVRVTARVEDVPPAVTGVEEGEMLHETYRFSYNIRTELFYRLSSSASAEALRKPVEVREGELALRRGWEGRKLELEEAVVRVDGFQDPRSQTDDGRVIHAGTLLVTVATELHEDAVLFYGTRPIPLREGEEVELPVVLVQEMESITSE